MGKIKEHISWNDKAKAHYYDYFRVVEELPTEYKELKKVELDVKNNNVYNYYYSPQKYDFYELTLENGEKEGICTLKDTYKKGLLK